MGLKFAITDLAGRQVAPIIERQPGSTVGVPLKGIQSCKVVIDTENPAADHVVPLSRRIKAWLDGAPLFNGPIIAPAIAGEAGTIEINALNAQHQLTAAYVQSPAVWALDPVTGVAYGLKRTQIDQGQIMADLIAHPPCARQAPWTTYPVGEHGILVLPWTASVKRDRSYEPGKQIWEAVSELSDVINGLEFHFEPQDREDGVTNLLRILPRYGIDRSSLVAFEYNFGRGNVTDLTYSVDSSEVENYATTIGQVEEGVPTPPKYVAQHLSSRNAFGTWESFEASPDLITQATVQEHAESAVSLGASPIRDVQITLPAQDGSNYLPGESVDQRRYGAPPRFGPGPSADPDDPDFYIGDLVSVFGRKDGLDVEGVQRVLNADVQEVNSQGDVQVSLQLSPNGWIATSPKTDFIGTLRKIVDSQREGRVRATTRG